MIVRITMTRQTVVWEEAPESYGELGGRCLTSTMIGDAVPADSKPLGTANRLIFAPGFLTGTPLVNTGRLSIGAKSPLTGGLKESNVGGTMATGLAGLGIRALSIEGKAPQGSLFVIVIHADATIEFLDAAKYQGKGTYDLCAGIHQDLGDQYSIATIGLAGEQQLSSASIQVTDTDGRPCRSAGRGGLGAVMGAKGLKALVVSTEGRVVKSLADPAGLKEINGKFAAAIKSDGWSGRVLSEFGTASIVGSTNGQGALPTMNARQGVYQQAEDICGETMVQRIRSRGGRRGHKGCSGCVINCSNVYADTEGKTITAALEYETIWAMGAMIANSDLDTIAKLDFLCDDLGLDTMNTGTAIAVAMDAGYLSFGDAKGTVALLEEVAQGTELGKAVGHGPDAVGKYVHNSRVPTVKGQSIAGYDPRAMPGMGVTYATSPMGADHTAGFVGAGSSTAALIQSSRAAQIHMAAIDSMGLCMFAQSGGLGNLFAAISAVSGRDFGAPQWQDLGDRCLRAELQFNIRAGLGKEDDRLPDMFYQEDFPPYYGPFSPTGEEMAATLAPFAELNNKPISNG